MADVSDCLEVSSGYGNLIRFDSGRYGVEFDSTGGADERIFGKDPTMVGFTAAVLYVDYIYLYSCATGGPISLCDGSGGSRIVSAGGSDVSYVNGAWGVWDFKDDPLVCMTAESTQSLCMSSAVNGYCGGFVKCWWGVAGA